MVGGFKIVPPYDGKLQDPILLGGGGGLKKPFLGGLVKIFF